MTNNNIYARFPVLYKNFIIFSTNNSIYKFNRNQNCVEVLLTTDDEIKHLKISKNKLIFLSQFEGGPDLYCMNLETKEVTRLTFKEEFTLKPLNFKENELIFISNEHSPISNIMQTYTINLETKEINKYKFHSIFSISENVQTKDFYVQKDEYGYLSWKNYKGGARGKLYKNNTLLINLPGQCISPVFIENRIYFIYEEDNDTNIYSCDETGKDLKKHTKHKEFKIQGLSFQNEEIIYTQMGEIYVYNIKTNKSELINIELNLISPKKNQRLSSHYLTSINNNDIKIICAVRGNIFEKNLYSGGLKQLTNELRFTHTGFLENKIFGIKDGRNTEFHIINDNNIHTIFKLTSQKIENIAVSKNNIVAYSNHKGELLTINMQGVIKTIAKAEKVITNFEWSKNGEWLVYELPKENCSSIILYNSKLQINYYIINDEYQNTSPSFDPENRFIVFLSNRNLNAKMEEIKFDYRLTVSENAYYVPIKKGYNMFTPWNQINENQQNNENSSEKELIKEFFDLTLINEKITPIKIKYKFNKIIALNNQLLGIISQKERVLFSLKTLTDELIKEEYDDIIITNNKQSIACIKDEIIKIEFLNEKAQENSWQNINFSLTNLESNISKKVELLNIFEELTWLMEEFFWSEENISEFKEKIQNYKNFLSKIHTEEELYEILKQVQGEMKTSHSYIFSTYSESTKGYLGINIENKREDIQIANFIVSSTKNIAHPILSTEILKGAKIKSINKNKATKINFDSLLINQQNKWISTEIEINNEIKEYDIKTISFKTYKRWLYEQWIKQQTNYVNSKNSEIAYIHIKDMSKQGFIDFFTKYINLYNKKSIIIDARYNSGGHISTLILEQLAKKKTGIDIPRHFAKQTIPHYTTEGNYVLLINENTASDGEIFAENFRQMQLGTIIGTRTWGGVVGIWPRYSLVNNLICTQPEFATKFFNTKNDIENYGVIPDIEILNDIDQEITPENDKQLNKAIETCLDFK